MCHEVPSRPWQKVGADLFTLHDKDYLVTVDYYSNYWEIDRLYGTLSTTVIQKLKAHFARYGIPDELVTDNGPQFTSSSFNHFTTKWDIQHRTSSLTTLNLMGRRNLLSNQLRGFSERPIETMKTHISQYLVSETHPNRELT